MKHLLFLVCLIPWLIQGQGAAAAATIVIKFPHAVSPSTPKGRGAQMFRDRVAERLGGRVVVEVYPSAQLMGDDDSLEALAFGEIQMIAVSLSKFDRLTKKFQVFDLPFLFEDIAAVERFQASPVGRSLLTTIENRGFLGLAFWHNGMKHFSAPKPLRKPGDASGLKFRVQVSDVLVEQIRQIGGNPQKMAFSEVYQALQTGAVDGQENTWSNIYSQKFHEVQDYIMVTNHGFIGYFVAVNPRFWRSLPGDIRAELEAIMAEVTSTVNALSTDINADAKQKVIDAGSTQIIELSGDEITVWRQAMMPVWDRFEDQIGPEILDAAKAASGDR